MRSSTFDGRPPSVNDWVTNGSAPPGASTYDCRRTSEDPCTARHAAKATTIPTNVRKSVHIVRRSPPGSGEGWFANTPDVRGGEPGSLNAFHTSAPVTYSPSDHVLSPSVSSAERMWGGAMKSRVFA